MNHLKKEGNNYYITHKRLFSPALTLSEFSDEVFKFAYAMSFEQVGEHRDHRTGGVMRRKNGEIFTNTFQGKLAEFGVFKFLSNHGINPAPPDMGIWKLGRWDDTDLEINNLKICIKSSAFFSNLMLLETKDWNGDGGYIPNANTGHCFYDFFILCRIKPDPKGIMQSKKMFYSDKADRNALSDIFLAEKWEFDIAGFLPIDELTQLIRNGFILPQGSMLNGKTKMDADNYYCQAGDLHPISKIIEHLK